MNPNPMGSFGSGTFLLALASTVVLSSETPETHDHNLLSHDSESRATFCCSL
jgi:hypothetical protein